MRTSLLLIAFSAVLSIVSAADCPVYLEPVEIIIPKADPPAPAPAPETVLPSPVESGRSVAELPLGIIGEVEPVFVEDIPIPFLARIDTGAALCSLDVEEVKYFERDGKSWVSFSIRHREADTVFPFEKRVKRNILIKAKEGDSIRRPVVALQIRAGSEQMVRDFSLADREHFEYQVLIGRNLLNGVAVVDISVSNTLAAE